MLKGRIMPSAVESIEIDAPVHKVFGLIAHQPDRMVDWWPPIELQKRVTPPPTIVGSVSRYVYNMIGIRIKGEHRVTAMEENRYLLVKTISGIQSAFEFTFSAVNDARTLLTVRVDYEMPGAILGQLLDRALIERKNIDDLEQGLRNLKSICETQVQV